MKKMTFLVFFAALWSMTATVSAQLTIGERYKFYSAAAPGQAVYAVGGYGDNVRFHWDLPGEGDYFKVNAVAGQGDDVFQFEINPTAFLKPSGGGISPCNTYMQASYDFTWWRLIPDEEIGGVQYYLLQHVVRPDRFMYFQESDQILYTNQVGEDGPPYAPEIRKYYQVAFEQSTDPALSISTTKLAFSSPFPTKTVTVTGTNITGDISFTLPEGISVSGTKVSGDKIAAADANAANTVTFTASSYNKSLEGQIVITTPGAAASQVIEVRGGLEKGKWYNLSLERAGYGVPVNLGDSIGVGDGLSHVASVVPDATALSQAFSFLPITYAGDETYNIRNAEGKFLAATEDENRNCIFISALTGSEYEEWALSGGWTKIGINYFDQMTLRVGRTDARGYYIGLNSDYIASGVPIASCFPKDWPRGTFKLIEAQAVVINYVHTTGQELKLPRLVLAGLTVDATYTASESDKASFTINGNLYTYNAAASTDQVVIGLNNSIINLVFDGASGINNVNTNKNYVVYANGNRQITVAGGNLASDLTASVYTVAGQLITTETLQASDHCIHLSQAGVYLVRINGNGVSETHKIVLK